MCLLGLIPLLNLLVGIVLLFAPGTDGPNRYGVRGGDEGAPMEGRVPLSLAK
jgi:hypothetical protein